MPNLTEEAPQKVRDWFTANYDMVQGVYNHQGYHSEPEGQDDLLLDLLRQGLGSLEDAVSLDPPSENPLANIETVCELCGNTYFSRDTRIIWKCPYCIQLEVSAQMKADYSEEDPGQETAEG
jgi:hypothetical protein